MKWDKKSKINMIILKNSGKEEENGYMDMQRYI